MFGQKNCSELKKQILQIEDAFGRAMTTNEAEEIGSFLGEDWIIIDPEGGIMAKAHFLSVIRSGALAHEAIDPKNLRVRVYGTTAVVTPLTASKANCMGQELSTRERADVFVNRDGKWQCVQTLLTTLKSDQDPTADECTIAGLSE